MKCQKCDADIPDGDLFCKECGAEVQLVPDYNSVEYLLQYQKNMEHVEYQRKLDEELIQSQVKKKKHKRKHPALIALGITAGLIILSVLVCLLIDNHNKGSYDYQYARAAENYEAGDYEKAKTYVEQALYLDTDSMDAELLLVDIMLHTEGEEEAIESLRAVIFNHPDAEAPYEKLISLYEQRGDADAIKNLMDACKSQHIRDVFVDYICPKPDIKTVDGTYKYKIRVEIENTDQTGQTLYYTVDGSNPTKDSTPYTGPVEMQEGDTLFQMVAYNARGIPSDVSSGSYTVTLARPNPPEVIPVSGTYKRGTKITVTVPVDCKAYYMFDQVASKSGNVYSEPVAMLNGEHIFSVILIDKNGKQSYPASVTYVAE